MCSNVTRTNWFSIKLVLLVSLFVNTVTVCSGVGRSDLYPFGNRYGDKQTPQIDDGGSDKLTLKQIFKFFGKNFTILYVNNNGILTFQNKLEEYKPQSFPSKENRSIIAPFWADVDTEHVGGHVWYRETFDQDLLDNATAEIRSYFLRQRKFTASWMFIVTWENVGYYGASKNGTSKRNTFQAVLTSDGIHSFVIFNYNKIVWTTGSNSDGETITGLGGNPAQAGFNAGDQLHYYSIEGAQTPAVINLTLTTNVGIPGKWVFQVDGGIDDNACENSKKILISPSSGYMLGGNQVNISGPCASSQYTIKAHIVEVNVTVRCQPVGGNISSCLFPPIFRTGEMTVVYSPYDDDSSSFYSTYVINNAMKKANEITRRSPEDWTIGALVECFWNSSLYPSFSARLDLLTYSDVNGPSLNVVKSFILSTNDTKHGEFRLTLAESLSSHSLAVIRLSMNTSSNSQTNPSVIWSDVFPVRWSSQGKSVSWCAKWIRDERSKSNITDLSSSCPCTLTQALRDVGRYHSDPLCNKDNSMSSTNCFYHSKASHCVHRNPNIHTTTGELCCYDSQGELLDIRDNLSGGTHNRYHYQAQGDDIVPYFSYFTEDLLPYLHCCQYSSNENLCQTFQKFRPPTTCQFYRPPSPAMAAGDPHLTTLDGVDYTFNGLGDFILVEDTNSSAVIQVRADQAKDSEGVGQNASVFTAIAFGARNISDIIEVYKTDTGNARILVNGQTFEMGSQSTSELKEVTISRNKSSDGLDAILLVSEVINLSVSLEVSSDLINILVMVGDESVKGHLHGLLGNFNGNKSDDLMSRNGTVISSSSSPKAIHYDFGMTWQVGMNESLFSDSVDNSVTYEPEFSVNRSFLRNGTEQLCKDNIQCIFDYQVTGDEKIAKSTLTFNEKFKQIQEDIEEVVRCPYLNTPENGNKIVSGHSVGDNATFWCNSPFVMLCSDCFLRVCRNDGTWSGSHAVCAEKLETGNGKEILPVAAGSAGGLGIVIICIVVFCLLFKRRKVPKPDEEQATEIDILSSIATSSANSTVFENEAFIESLKHLNVSGPFRIPRPSFVNPELFDEFFF